MVVVYSAEAAMPGRIERMSALYLWGGYDGVHFTLNDMWMFNVRTAEWSLVGTLQVTSESDASIRVGRTGGAFCNGFHDLDSG